jgi:hypothetical protein
MSPTGGFIVEPTRQIALATVLVLATAACGPNQTEGATTPSTSASPRPASAVLIFDTETCRNSGTVRALGVVWELVEAVPIAWRRTGEREGSLTVVEGQNATFTADDGTELKVTSGPHEEECLGWSDDGG